MLSEPHLCIHTLSPRLAPLDPQGHADELWQAIAELPPAPTAWLLCAKTGGDGAGGGHPTLPPVLGGMGVLSVMHQRCVSALPHATHGHCCLPSIGSYLGSPCFAKGQICPFVTSDFIWCIIKNKEVTCYLFLTLFSQDRPVGWFLPCCWCCRLNPAMVACRGSQEEERKGAGCFLNAVYLNTEVCLSTENSSHMAPPLMAEVRKRRRKGHCQPQAAAGCV